MALKAVHVTDVPNLDHVPDNASLSLYSSTRGTATSNFMMIGHRENGMNVLQSSDLRMKAVKENIILSFNTASKHPIDFIEFDVQKVNDPHSIIDRETPRSRDANPAGVICLNDGLSPRSRWTAVGSWSVDGGSDRSRVRTKADSSCKILSR